MPNEPDLAAALLREPIGYFRCDSDALVAAVQSALDGMEVPIGPNPTAHLIVNRLGPRAFDVWRSQGTYAHAYHLHVDMTHFSPGWLLHMSQPFADPLVMQTLALLFAAIQRVCPLPPIVETNLGGLLTDASAWLDRQAAPDPANPMGSTQAARPPDAPDVQSHAQGIAASLHAKPLSAYDLAYSRLNITKECATKREAFHWLLAEEGIQLEDIEDTKEYQRRWEAFQQAMTYRRKKGG